jgi:hypothetical protein
VIIITKDSSYSIEFDAVMREVHTNTVSVTAHPVEKGAAVNDHIRPEPDKLSIEAWVSDTPLVEPATQTDGVRGSVTSESMTVPYSQMVAPGTKQTLQMNISFQALRFDGKLARRIGVYTALREVQEQGKLCSVRNEAKGGLRDYDEMVIVSISLPRGVENGTAQVFNIEMQHVRIVETRRVDAGAPAAAPKKKKKKKGNQGKKEITDKDKKKESVSHSLKESVKEALPRLFSGG